MKKYESVFILDVRLVDDEGKAFTKELTELLEGWGGSVEESTVMGRKQFAREINKRKAGLYLNFIFTLDADKVKDISTQFKHDERVLRDMTIVFDRPDDMIVAGDYNSDED
ncbi:30S ribosomal protein S6 [Lentisphaerota bacterium WC36G]|nr:30S ribosomal protein S6 [Lentisphaerae bacterium WC36]